MKTQSLRTRISAILIMVVTAITIVFGSVQTVLIYWNLEKSLNREMKATTDHLISQLGFPLYEYNLKQIEQTVQTQMRDRRIVGIIVLDIIKSKLLVGKTRNDKWGIIDTQVQTPPLKNNFFASNISFNGRDIGKIQLIYTKRFVKELLLNGALRAIITMVLLLMVTAFSLSIIISKIIISPINKLKLFTEIKINTETDCDHVVDIIDVARKDEIGDLVRSFSNMREIVSEKIMNLDSANAQLNESNLELKKHRDHLETLVRERTSELTDSNNLLKDSENRYRTLSDAAFEGIVIIENGTILEANNAMVKMFGYQTTELVGMEALYLADQSVRKEIQNKILSGYEKPYESFGTTKDGIRFPIDVHAKVFSYKGREVRVTAVRDLTEQKKAEEEIETLRGILPLCSFCKKIRDDKGYWEMVDVYIDKHSQADISHGICPDCMKEHYPEAFERIQQKKIKNGTVRQ